MEVQIAIWAKSEWRWQTDKQAAHTSNNNNIRRIWKTWLPSPFIQAPIFFKTLVTFFIVLVISVVLFQVSRQIIYCVDFLSLVCCPQILDTTHTWHWSWTIMSLAYNHPLLTLSSFRGRKAWMNCNMDRVWRTKCHIRRRTYQRRHSWKIPRRRLSALKNFNIPTTALAMRMEANQQTMRRCISMFQAKNQVRSQLVTAWHTEKWRRQCKVTLKPPLKSLLVTFSLDSWKTQKETQLQYTKMSWKMQLQQ